MSSTSTMIGEWSASKRSHTTCQLCYSRTSTTSPSDSSVSCFYMMFLKDKTDREIKSIKFVQLGLMVSKPSYEKYGGKSPLVKYKYANGETEPDADGNTKSFTVGTVVRANGRIEFYSDFMLVEEHYEEDAPCVDAETDA